MVLRPKLEWKKGVVSSKKLKNQENVRFLLMERGNPVGLSVVSHQADKCKM
jgi:hypothetical protein